MDPFVELMKLYTQEEIRIGLLNIFLVAHSGRNGTLLQMGFNPDPDILKLFCNIAESYELETWQYTPQSVCIGSSQAIRVLQTEIKEDSENSRMYIGKFLGYHCFTHDISDRDVRFLVEFFVEYDNKKYDLYGYVCLPKLISEEELLKVIEL